MKNSYFAVGKENYKKGNLPDSIRYGKDIPYYVHFMARFELKPDHIPFLRTRCDKIHSQLEILETSAYYDGDGNRFDVYDAPGEEFVDEWGEIHPDCKPFMVELCLYRDEFELFFEQYDVFDIEYIDYVWWYGRKGLFTEYVDEFYEMKKNAKGKAERRIAKIFLNALSGRLSLIKEHENMYLCSDVENMLNNYGTFDYSNKNMSSYGKYSNGFAGETVSSFIKGSNNSVSRSKTHIQIGAAITSMAMCYIVKYAQKFYDKFLYTDTDSLHLCAWAYQLNPEDIKIGTELGEFKVEHIFRDAVYHKPKIYTFMEMSEVAPEPVRYKLNYCKGFRVTWAGMPEECQKVLEKFLTEAFLHKHRLNISDEDMEETMEILRNGARPAHISDMEWELAMKAWDNHMLRGEVFKMGLPYVHKVVKSYKNFELEWKTDWYHVDMLERVC